MKSKISAISGKIILDIGLIFLIFVLNGAVNKLAAQWSFSWHSWGEYCTGCGSGYDQSETYSYPTKSQCETARQFLNLGLGHGQDTYSHTNTYTGSSENYTATPCMGSDLTTNTNQLNFGSVSIDGQILGAAFFSPHPSSAMEDWGREYMQRLKSMGISDDEIKLLSTKQVPLTGDFEFDKSYNSQVVRFEKPEQGGVVDLSGKTGIVGSLKDDAKVDPKIVDPNILKKDDPNGITNQKPIVPLPNSEQSIIESDHPIIENIQDFTKSIVSLSVPGWVGYGLNAGINILAEDFKAIADIKEGKDCPSTSTILSNAFQKTKEDAIGGAKEAIDETIDSKALYLSKYIGIKGGIKPLNIARAVKTVEWATNIYDKAGTLKEAFDYGYNVGTAIQKQQ